MRKPIIGIIGKSIEFNEKYLWHQFTCYDEIRYLIVKNGGIAIELLPTQPILDFVDVEPDYTRSQNQDCLTDSELADLDRQIDLCDGFVIQGGLRSSKFEVEFAKKIIEKDKPLIGICAGFNNILRAVGSDVILDESKSHDFFDINYRHNVDIVPSSKLFDLLGINSLSVNSIHSMIAPKELVEPFAKVNAFSDDGLVECFELENKKFVLGFKWHPELMLDDNTDSIFKSFIDACK